MVSGVLAGLAVNAAYFRRVVADFGLDDSCALLLAGETETVGVPFARLRDIARRADVLINISGLLTDETLTARVPLRVYLDLDPAFNQLWYAAQQIDMRFDGHSHFVTIGQAIGRPGCCVPTCGRAWITTPQPVVLTHWPAAEHLTYDGLTTIANWRGYGSIDHDGLPVGRLADGGDDEAGLDRAAADDQDDDERRRGQGPPGDPLHAGGRYRARRPSAPARPAHRRATASGSAEA